MTLSLDSYNTVDQDLCLKKIRYTDHSPNDHSPNDQSPNDQSPNDQSPKATILRTTILRKGPFSERPISENDQSSEDWLLPTRSLIETYFTLMFELFPQFKSSWSTLSSKIQTNSGQTNPWHNKPWTLNCFKTFTHSPGFSLSAAPDFSSLP
jgi:hypothetical protein